MKRAIHRIAEHYGYEAQSGMLVEEMAELIQATNKYNRKPSEKNFWGICEEIADVEIMLSQIKYLLDINQDSLDEIKATKIERQIVRIEGNE